MMRGTSGLHGCTDHLRKICNTAFGLANPVSDGLKLLLAVVKVFTVTLQHSVYSVDALQGMEHWWV